MDAGRQWALETLGPYGPYIRKRLPAMIKAEHDASADAQEASGHRSRGVYGEFWRGLLEKFETFGGLPEATLVRPGDAPYRLPVVNGSVLFPWRYAKSREAELAATRFATSDARTAVAALRRPTPQGVLDLGIPDPDLNEEDRQLLEAIRSDNSVLSSCRLVVVAVSSSYRGLFAAEWGEAKLHATGCVDWVNGSEDLLHLLPSKPVSTSPTGSFTDGVPPKKFPDIDLDETANNPNHE